jgi:hypothetical protein
MLGVVLHARDFLTLAAAEQNRSLRGGTARCMVHLSAWAGGVVMGERR